MAIYSCVTEEEMEGGFYLTILIFIICEVFMAFGVTALLVGLRHIFNRKEWFIRIIDKSWNKAVKYSLLMPVIGFLIGIALKLMELLR